jgi:hypothetical protein
LPSDRELAENRHVPLCFVNMAREITNVNVASTKNDDFVISLPEMVPVRSLRRFV